MQKILRHETLFGRTVPIMDASHLTKEREINDIKVFKIDHVINENKIFLGFGKPNVFIGYKVNEKWYKFDAKSIKRAPSKITFTKGFAQSGLIFLIANTTTDMIENIQYESEKLVGTKNWTCVNSNCQVLENAGFTSGDIPLSNFYFPMPLARHIIKNGLYYNDEKVEIQFIKTVQNYLESFGMSVIKSQWNILSRHTTRYLREKRKKFKLLEKLNNLKYYIFSKKVKIDDNIEDIVTYFPTDIECKNDLILTISRPSRFGILLRLIWGPHSFFSIEQKNNTVEKYLPEKLTAYENKKLTFVNLTKQYILFSKPVIKFIQRHLHKTEEVFENSSEKDLYNMLRTHTENKPHKYNLVITGNKISIIKIEIKYGIVDWILSKHILLSGYSTDVRYAGEFWKSKDGEIYFNNNSGTYAPSNQSIHNAKDFLKEIFPNTKINTVKFI
jgi:hypothetical protein